MIVYNAGYQKLFKHQKILIVLKNFAFSYIKLGYSCLLEDPTNIISDYVWFLECLANHRTVINNSVSSNMILLLKNLLKIGVVAHLLLLMYYYPFIRWHFNLSIEDFETHGIHHKLWMFGKQLCRCIK